MRPVSKKTAVVLTAIALFISIPAVVLAGHNQFTDVPDDHTFHDSIGWMLENGITVGCNPPANDNYCPGEDVNRGQMASFMKRLSDAQVVDANTAITAGTVYEAINDSGVDITGGDADFANSVATLGNLPAGSYLVNATWTATVIDTPSLARIVCTLTAGSSSAAASAEIDDTATTSEESMAAVTTGTLADGDEVNLSCYRENEEGSQSIGNARIVAYPVNEVISETVSS